jgi:hypothetical protein
MADRYWVGGTGTWNGTNVLNWSDASGGLPGASVPTSADNVFFDANSNVGTGAFTVTIATVIASCLNFSASGLDGAMTLTVNRGVFVFGSWLSAPNLTISGILEIFFSAVSGVQTITSNGRTFDCPVLFDGVGGTWQLQDALTVGASRAFSLVNGTFDANNFNVTLGIFRLLSAGTKTLTLGSGTWTVLGTGSGAWNTSTSSAGLTVSASTATINMTSASAKTFNGGGFTWPTLNQGGAGALTIASSNTFANITNTVQPATIRFTAGTTQTFSAFSVSGTSGNLITLDTTVAGTRATLSDGSGTNAVSFTSIKDLAATGGATWSSPTVSGNVDAGNNTGWDFITPPAPPSSGVTYPTALRSFTERTRF